MGDWQLARVTTGTGDDGYTGLLGAERVAKYHPRVVALGELDEATSALGLARSLTGPGPLADLIRELQNGLYLAMADVAVSPDAHDRFPPRITGDLVRQLETQIEELKRQVDVEPRFVIPGDTTAGAATDLARAVMRRAERAVARLTHEGAVHNPLLIKFLNRASDLLFVLARLIDKQREQG